MKLSTLQTKIAHIPTERYPEVGRLLCLFLDVTATATARKSFYNSREELQQATEVVHREVFELDRGMYGLLLALPGVLDYSKQQGVQTLLAQPGYPPPPWGNGASLLTLSQETRLITWLTRSLPPQRRLKLFGALKEARVNNARTRRLILRTILDQPDLEWAAVKYRRKIAAALRHAWGIKMTGIIKSMLAKTELTGKERKILQANLIDPILYGGDVCECLSFILGNEGPWTLPKLGAYEEAKIRFRAGKKLPPEVMEGIRSTYHPHRSSADVMELTERQATTGQRIAVQRAAKEKGVEVAFDPAKYDLVRLYVYAYEMEMDNEIWKAIREKTVLKAAHLPRPMQFEHVGIVVDTSYSMMGSEEQKHRPIATALAIKNVLQAASESHSTFYTTGVVDDSLGANSDLPVTVGETSLAEAFLKVVEREPDSVFIISDGYENAPAGRLAETVARLRQMGNDTPIYQLSPVMAAETYGTRPLANDVPVLPVNQTINLGMGMIKLMLGQDFIRGMAALIEMIETETTNVLRLEG